MTDFLTQRLRAQYPVGPTLANGQPEFGFRDMSGPIETVFPTKLQIEAAAEIERLQGALLAIKGRINGVFDDPNLVLYGALNVDSQEDVLSIATEALKDA